VAEFFPGVLRGQDDARCLRRLAGLTRLNQSARLKTFVRLGR
jgi:hypothetical protein